MTKEDFFRKELVKELQNIAQLMKKEKNAEKKIYYFSASYGITNRTYRYVFSSEVLLADLVLNTSYQALHNRVNQIKSGDTTVQIDDKVFDALYEGLQSLASAFEDKKPIQDALGIILTASFSVSGPGNYLKEKNMLKI